jgi:hypothetical protein
MIRFPSSMAPTPERDPENLKDKAMRFITKQTIGMANSRTLPMYRISSADSWLSLWICRALQNDLQGIKKQLD